MKSQNFVKIDELITEEKKTMEIIPTGLHYLDDILEGGFIKKELVGLGGKTGGGKSLMAGTIFYNIVREGNSSAYFSLEISNQTVAARMLGAKADISSTRLMIHELRKEEQEQKDKAFAEIATYDKLMHFYDDMYYLEDIVKEIEENDFDFLVIDFIQNVMTRKPFRDEKDKLGFIALTLQKLAKKKNCVIMVVSQLSNEQARNRKTSDVVEYKGSGAIGHAVDLGFFIESGRAGEGSLSLKLRKNRRGISGTSLSFMIKQPGGRIIEL